VNIEERSFVAKGAPLDDGEKRFAEWDKSRQSRIVHKYPSRGAFLRHGQQDETRSAQA
jgi:hypothetical protein